MNIFIIFFGIHLLGSIDFEISIISTILCILMFLIIAFRKVSIMECLFFSLNFFC
jgi:hypothetical protein